MELKLEFHIVFMYHKMYSLEISFQAFKIVKLSLSSWTTRK